MSRQSKQRQRHGFTLVELVVVIVLAIVLLVVLVWPNVAAVRERARRINCLAHLNEMYKTISTWGLDSADGYRNALDKVSPEVFICSSAGRLCRTQPDTNCYYQYYSYRRDADGDKILICDMNGPNQIAGANAWGANHDGQGGNAITGSGSGLWVDSMHNPGQSCITNPEIVSLFSTNNEIQILPLHRQRGGNIE